MKKQLFLLLFVLFAFQLYSQTWNIQYSWDTISFESNYPYLEIDSSIQNIWQIGEPGKEYFDSAYSINRAILTDSLHPYPINNYSFFDIKIGSFNYDFEYPGNIFIGFEHKFDTDKQKDGGYLTISYDLGKTWMNIIEDTVYSPPNPLTENSNLYTENDTLFNGEKGFSGHSNDWISTFFGWVEPPAKKSLCSEIGDTMILRFNFISDSINTNSEGWLIDDIRLYSVFLSGITDYKERGLLNIYPNPASSEINIEFKNNLPFSVSIFDLYGHLILEARNQKIIKLNNFSNGTYIIKVKQRNGILTSRLIVIRN